MFSCMSASTWGHRQQQECGDLWPFARLTTVSFLFLIRSNGYVPHSEKPGPLCSFPPNASQTAAQAAQVIRSRTVAVLLVLTGLYSEAVADRNVGCPSWTASESFGTLPVAMLGKWSEGCAWETVSCQSRRPRKTVHRENLMVVAALSDRWRKLMSQL